VRRSLGGRINIHYVPSATPIVFIIWRKKGANGLEYPKKITKNFPGEKPVIIIRASGEPGAFKVKEYRLIKEIGKMGIYK
jgi:hypothetical protein